MNAILRPAVSLVLLLTLVTGVAAPLAMTGIAQLVFPRQANDSLVERNGKVIGSSLIGLNFQGGPYLHPRPAATSEPGPESEGRTRPAPYNAAASAASQLGPTSSALAGAVKDRVAGLGGGPVPADA